MDSTPTQVRAKKLDRSLRIFGIANCALGLIVLVYVVLFYFAIHRAIQNEASITTENYHYMLLSVRLIMLGLAPLLGVLFIWTGAHSLRYLHKKKQIDERTHNDA